MCKYWLFLLKKNPKNIQVKQKQRQRQKQKHTYIILQKRKMICVTVRGKKTFMA